MCAEDKRMRAAPAGELHSSMKIEGWREECFFAKSEFSFQVVFLVTWWPPVNQVRAHVKVAPSFPTSRHVPRLQTEAQRCLEPPTHIQTPVFPFHAKSSRHPSPQSLHHCTNTRTRAPSHPQTLTRSIPSASLRLPIERHTFVSRRLAFPPHSARPLSFHQPRTSHLQAVTLSKWR